MSLPGPFLAGQRLTAGQLNDATQKTLDSVSISVAGLLHTTSGTTELNVPRLALGPVPLVSGGLYRLTPRALLTNTVNSDQFVMRVRRDTALTGTLLGELTIGSFAPTVGNAYAKVSWLDYPASADEAAVSFFFSLLRTSGSGTMSIYGQLSTSARSGSRIERAGYSSEYRVSS